MSQPTNIADKRTRPDWFIIGFMTVIHVLAIIALFNFDWPAFTAFVVLYAATVLGITFGFHRLFTHRSFKASKTVEYGAAVLGTIALQGTIREWVGHHRMHHAWSDTAKDPHDASQGFWHSHLLWMMRIRPEFNDDAKLKRFTRDIDSDPFLTFLSKPAVMIGMQVALGLFLLAIGGWSMALWGVFARLVAVYHVTWFVNSASHMWGYKNYQVDDLATNNWWVGLLAFGEGWHNNHHAYPNVAPAGHKWWEFDITWQVIKALQAVGHIWDVKLPPSMAQEAAGSVSRAPQATPATAVAGE